MFFHICNGQVIYREDTVLATGFDRHVCDRETVIHAQVFDSFTNKFHGFVKSSVHTDQSDDVQDHIFAAYPFCRFADQVKFNCRRYFKPCFSGYHTGCHVGTSDTGGECSQCSVCTGMRICTNDHISCHGQSFFRKQCVFDSHLSYVKIIGDLIFTGKFTYTFAVFC